MKKLVYIFICAFCLLSCKKETYVKPDYLIFGAIQGNCANNCRFVYYLNDTKLSEDLTVKYFALKDINLFTTEISTDKFLLVKDLINKVPTALTQTSKSLFIDLNASSPNLWYAEIKLDGRIYNWTFDNATSSTPSYLKPFADEMIKTIELIR